MKPGSTRMDSHALEVSLDGHGPAIPKSEIDAWLEKGRGGFSTEELRGAFLQVANADHWKMDIDAVVPAEMREVLEFAIPWHTGGGGVAFEDLGSGRLRVTAPGYWTNGMEG